MKTPLISLLICNYNYDKYVVDALSSAVRQDYPNLEIVIIDDGSNDRSVEVIEAFISKNRQKNITLIAKKKNKGICYARNDALEAAKGDFFLFLDSDDTIPENYVSSMYAVAMENKADVVYGDMKSFGGSNAVTNFPEYSPNELLTHNYVNIASLVKKEAVNNHRFDEKLNRKTLEDYDFWVGLSLMGLKFVKSNKAALNYRVQKQSRNDNTSDYVTHAMKDIEIWKYIITKYSKKYPKKITEDVVYKKLEYQINDISRELSNLNTIVQKELIPELIKREEHIKYLDAKLNSKEYKVGRILLKPLRSIIKIVGRN